LKIYHNFIFYPKNNNITTKTIPITESTGYYITQLTKGEES